jgi:hypothetical protein
MSDTNIITVNDINSTEHISIRTGDQITIIDGIPTIKIVETKLVVIPWSEIRRIRHQFPERLSQWGEDGASIIDIK